MDTTKMPDETKLPGHQYTLGEMRQMIKKMRAVNRAFYGPATMTGCHAFIEFCGLQSKFIDMCEEALRQGHEFAFANTHNKTGPKLDGHHVAYLAEKFNCIYGFAMDEKAQQQFMEQAF